MSWVQISVLFVWSFDVLILKNETNWLSTAPIIAWVGTIRRGKVKELSPSRDKTARHVSLWVGGRRVLLYDPGFEFEIIGCRDFGWLFG